MKRFFALFVALILCLSALAGCGDGPTTLDIIQDGMDTYVGGRIETPDYMPPSVLDMLNDMIDTYANGVWAPSGSTVPLSATDTFHTTVTSTGDGAEGTASDMSVAEDILRAAICDTAPYVVIHTTNFTISNNQLISLVNKVIRTEAIGFMCISSYSYLTSATVTGGGVTTVEFNYTLPIETVKQMKLDADAAAQQVVDDLGLMSMDYIERVEAVNQYLCDTVEYPEHEPYREEAFTAYGALIDGSAVCDGYARAAQRIFELCGVESMYISGDTPESGHAWNMVKVGNVWYHLDVTWNNGSTTIKDYYLVSDDYMAVSRVWDTSIYPRTPVTNYPA